MDQNVMILVIVAVALSMVTVAMLLLKVPRQIFLIWAMVEGLLLFGIVAWLFLLQPGS